jgi:hypothetical protein
LNHSDQIQSKDKQQATKDGISSPGRARAGEVSVNEIISLRAAFAKIPDSKQPYTYPLEGVLTLIGLAMMCGKNGEREIARWAQAQRWTLAERLGFPREKMPSLGTIQEALRRVPAAVFSRVISEWTESVFQAYGRPAGAGVAIDGKVVRGSRTPDQSALHLLSAFAHEVKLVLGQTPVAERTNEIGGIDPLLADLVLEGRVVTVDAQLTQRAIAETIREKGGTI